MGIQYEYYTTGDDNNLYIDGVQWGAQTFTPATAHFITSVKLKLWRIGSPGTLTVSIRATSGGKPSGGELCSGTYNANLLNAWPDGPSAWVTITLTGFWVTASTEYAIVFRAISGNVTNAVLIRTNTSSSGYANGTKNGSNNSGVDWGDPALSQDFLFEDWGVIGYAAPYASTQAATAITSTTATANGNVITLGFPSATQYGHVWATFPYPTVDSYAGKTTKGVPGATGAYTSSMTGLLPFTLYRCRSYITNSIGTFYGEQVGFSTLGDVPTVTTNLPDYIGVTTALGEGSIENNGGSAVTEHGMCWDTSADPTTTDSASGYWGKTTDGATDVIGGFFSLMLGLTGSTTYHVRAYATNSSGTGYGGDISFTTGILGAPIVTTERTTNLGGAASAVGNGTIVDTGETDVTQHGHCWSTSSYPTTADNSTELGSGAAGSFISIITGLLAGTTYHTRAYATNSFGTSYGNDDTFKLYGEGVGILQIQNNALWYVDANGDSRYLIGVQGA